MLVRIQPEIFLDICTYLDTKEVLRVISTCKHFSFCKQLLLTSKNNSLKDSIFDSRHILLSDIMQLRLRPRVISTDLAVHCKPSDLESLLISSGDVFVEITDPEQCLFVGNFVDKTRGKKVNICLNVMLDYDVPRPDSFHYLLDGKVRMFHKKVGVKRMTVVSQFVCNCLGLLPECDVAIHRPLCIDKNGKIETSMTMSKIIMTDLIGVLGYQGYIIRVFRYVIESFLAFRMSNFEYSIYTLNDAMFDKTFAKKIDNKYLEAGSKRRTLSHPLEMSSPYNEIIFNKLIRAANNPDFDFDEDIDAHVSFNGEVFAKCLLYVMGLDYRCGEDELVPLLEEAKNICKRLIEVLRKYF